MLETAWYSACNACFLLADITVGYNQTDVTVTESDGVARLTVKILMPDENVPIDSEVMFFLLVNTSDGTERGLVPSLEFDLCTHTLDIC